MYGLHSYRWLLPPTRKATKLHHPNKARNLFFFSFRFFYNSLSPNSPISFDLLLKSCNTLKPLKEIHSLLSTNGFILNNPHLGSQIIIKYSKFGNINASRSLFDSIKGCDSFLWNTMIRAYTNAGCCNETLELYSAMHRMGIQTNNYTYPFVLKACASKSLAFGGKLVHLDVIRNGFDSDAFVQAALVDMYAKCGEIDNGRRVFDTMSIRDLVCWTAMITGYEQAERATESLILLSQMQEEGLVADSVTSVTVASAVGQLGDVQKSRSVHAHVIRNGFLEDLIVANSILAMYSKCGDVKAARMVFEEMKAKDGISWNSMLSGYTQNGYAAEALLLFDQMRASVVQPNPVTALIAVSACAYLGSLHLGRKVHSFIVASSMKINTTLWNAIIDMYAKCGDLETAGRVFDDVHESGRNVSSWNVMISGYGMHGHGKEALHLFSRMQEEGVESNHITFTCLLSACSHAGLVDEGRKCFNDMRKKLFTKPTMKHYACMVDLLGRNGLLEEAQALIAEMPFEPNDAVWGALLGACRIHGNAEMGEIAAKNLFCLEPEHSGYYILMSNIYAASNQWHEVGMLRQAMKSRGLKKPAAFSVIEFGKEIHGFHTADRTHPEWMDVYKKVEILAIEMKMVGYIPDRSCVLHDVEEEDKEHILNYHSEKLAVAFGIMRMDAGMPIHVTKNLRVCGDCHSAFKFISYIHKRKIVVRDANRFHHFQNGCCSCRDYW